MAATVREQIRSQAVELLKSAPHGLRYSELMAKIQEVLPGVPKNTIAGNIWNLEVVVPEQVYKPARGMYLHVQHRESPVAQPPKVPAVPIETPKEQAFYEPFADWLVNELEECTKAMPVGGNRFKDKWGTPDVIGVREPRKSDIVKFGYGNHHRRGEDRHCGSHHSVWSGVRVPAFQPQVVHRGARGFPGRRRCQAGHTGSHLRHRTDPVQCQKPEGAQFRHPCESSKARARHVLRQPVHEVDRRRPFHLIGTRHGA